MVDQVKGVAGLSLSAEEVVADYRLAARSRQMSLLGRQEALGGKAGFGIFGDGKEVPQVALARFMQPGDFRSGYYRDQTLMLATGVLTVPAFFAQLYGHTDVEAEPASGGRQMNAHFATRSLDEQGRWRDLTQMVNTAADMSCTGAQMPRIAGLVYASRLYRELPELKRYRSFSNGGSEVIFGTIGNASCAEGMFWETVNAVGVLGGPLVLAIWDDDYGISVTNEYQVTKGDVSQALQGFRRDGDGPGYELVQVRGWDYPALVAAFGKATALAREQHVPTIVHVTELTQPQGHSSSGSHERYKPAERLAWEEEWDCLRQMRLWLLDEGIAREEELAALEAEEKAAARAAQEAAWAAAIAPIEEEMAAARQLLDDLAAESNQRDAIADLSRQLARANPPRRRQIVSSVQEALIATRGESGAARSMAQAWLADYRQQQQQSYATYLTSETERAASRLPEVPAVYDDDAPELPGHRILNACFDAMLSRDPRVVAFGQDLGRLGDVNLGFAGLQEKYGELRVGDTGIRETTIIGQAIGLALRGLRPVAEIQYLDYLLYGLQIMADDIANLHWRTHGGQRAPVIIRTRGHRQVGIWHAGSPMAGIINLVRGMHVLVPRNMTQAAGFYNTLLLGQDPALMVEVLNGYRLKERLPANIDRFTVPLGVPEVLRAGTDITVVTYGACVRVCLEAADQLAALGVEVEVIDVQTLLPFDTRGVIVDSLRKTSRVVFVDEDVPGGTTAYMMQQVIDAQEGFFLLDSPPRALSAQSHRPAYGADGDYFSKPSVDDVVREVFLLMNESNPNRYPRFDAPA